MFSRILVAFDGSDHAKQALRDGVELARAEDVDEIQRQALREVDPKIDLRRRVLNGGTAEALADACMGGVGVDLLVVGSRGHGTIERVLLGSTSSALIEKAPCPVLVVPRPAERGSRPARDGDVQVPA